MRIKRVEIIGFKSFCDRAVIQIDASVTGVVGPNGCGKSNIVDAIRWCMGEQSAKHLRGKAMEDVIFAGSETRGPAPMAEVSLTFDDVGFSHETLELAKHSDVAETERIADGIPDDQAPPAEPVESLVSADAAEPAGVWTDAEGNPIASPQEEVQELLSDAPPAIDFGAYTEVAITRRLYRDGTSQYFINKTPCRLRDITDFFLGTGAGTKAYAIIEQGRIGQIVSSRPTDRRAIIEEAAGITKFKAKKKAAERKLDQTRQNLMRVSDIVGELDKRMGTLRRQAQKAERFRKYKAELRDIELWKASHRWLELRGEASLVGERLGIARTEHQDVRTAFDAKDAHAIAERAELAIEERRLAGVQDKVYELDNKLRLGETKLELERREAGDLDARVASARHEIEQIAAERERGASELAERSSELAALASDVEREQADVQARDAAAGEARQMVTNVQGRLDEARVELAQRRTEVATCGEKLDALTRRKDEATRRLERVMGEVDMHHERVRELERERNRASGQLAELRQTRLDLGTQTNDFVTRRDQLADEVSRGEAEVETLRTEVHRRTSRLASLKEIHDRYEGFARGTRAVMQRADEIGGGADAIRGVVADVVRAPEQLEIAVEAALGDRLGGVLVSEPSVGVAAVGFLKGESGGRGTFVPVRTASASSYMSADGGGSVAAFEYEDRTALIGASLALRDTEGVLGKMADLVQFADGFESVGQALLGGAVVVDRLERAVSLHEKGAVGIGERLITLDGDVVDHDGVVAGGSRDAQGSGVLAQKREIRELEDIVGKLEHDLSEAMQRLVTGKAELKQVGKAIEGLRTQAHEGDLAIMSHEKDESRLRADLDRHKDRLGHLATEQLELEERLRAIASDDESTRTRQTDAASRIEHLERVQLDLAAEVTAHRDRLDDLARDLTEARVRAAQLGEKRAAAEAATLRLSRADGELAARGERLVREIDDAAQRAGSLRAAGESLASELEEVRTARIAELGELERGRAGYTERMGALTSVELDARELRSRTDELSKELNQLELRSSQIAMTRKVVEDGLTERYQVETGDLGGLLADYHQRPLVSETEEARRVELRDLLERMGTDINLTAIDEFAEVSKRFEFLSAQKTDLERAVDQLQRAIDKINKTSRRLFRDTFTAVNATFKEVFPRLFRGGQAHLSLATPTERNPGAGAAAGDGGDGAPAPAAKEIDILEAGVEIFAQPPGKKNSTVDQLSGGEKALTAVALVFSIFLIKPSPFCILDEVDAPLDEANVDRYNELVREMTDRSQFIVITHNKRTMESADNLYGVTMQEPGVSKLVTVNLRTIGAQAQGRGGSSAKTTSAAVPV
jgi:chromosome segregation protein|nr:chromosome segregation protein SMC [Kofleriaceae bacterium]